MRHRFTFKTLSACYALSSILLISGCAGSNQENTVSQWMASISSDQIDYKIIRIKTKNTEDLRQWTKQKRKQKTL